jgi:plastocyanin
MQKRLHSPLVVLAATIGAVALLTSCGGSDDKASGLSTSVPSAAATTRAADAASGAAAPTRAQGTGVTVPAGAPVIDQADLLFKPEKIAVKAGDTVYFTNHDDALHSVNINGKNILGATGASMKKGEASSWKAAAAGTYTVTCDYHPAMKATIAVQ